YTPENIPFRAEDRHTDAARLFDRIAHCNAHAGFADIFQILEDRTDLVSDAGHRRDGVDILQVIMDEADALEGETHFSERRAEETPLCLDNGGVINRPVALNYVEKYAMSTVYGEDAGEDRLAAVALERQQKGPHRRRKGRLRLHARIYHIPKTECFRAKAVCLIMDFDISFGLKRTEEAQQAGFRRIDQRAHPRQGQAVGMGGKKFQQLHNPGGRTGSFWRIFSHRLS